MMKIKHLLSLLLLFSLTCFGQDMKEKRDQIKALKVSFFTTELNLSSEESAKFWPVYNAFEQKQFEIRHEKMRPLTKKIEGLGDKISDKDALAYLDQIQQAEEELFNLRRKLVTDMKPIIGPVKTLRLKKAEEDFNKKLLQTYKGKGKGN
jgi:hypothetical protein